jgi:hypothetical protein
VWGRGMFAPVDWPASPASSPPSFQVLSVMRQALSTAQRLILSTEGTLTTLVAALVAPTSSSAAAAAMCATAGSNGANQKQPASAAASRHGSATGRLGGAGDKQQQQQQQQPYVVCAMAVGDSPAYVWRQRQGVVEELTAAGRHAEDGGHRWGGGGREGSAVHIGRAVVVAAAAVAPLHGWAVLALVASSTCSASSQLACVAGMASCV